MRLLLLAGTLEAAQICYGLSRDTRVTTVASVGRPMPGALKLRVPMRIGGWGSEEGFADWIESERIDAVLDATHPFSVGISRRTSAVCRALDVPYAQFLRPSWIPGPEDKWIFLNSETEAAYHVQSGDPVLLATGRARLEAFSGLGDRPIYVRVRDRAGTPFPFERGGFLHRPIVLPVAAEVSGLQSFGITSVVARNTGGNGLRNVLEAARHLGLPVGMIRRPMQPEGPKIQTISEAMSWVRRRL